MAIHNSSYPASSNQSPHFSISLHSSPLFSVSHNNSPLFTMSNSNSPHIYSNGPGADHGSSIITTSTFLAGAHTLPWECDGCGLAFSTEMSRDSHDCNRSFRRELYQPRFRAPILDNPLIGSSAIGDRGRGGLAVYRIYDCPHPTCDRKGGLGFSRLESLIEHSRNIHNQHVPGRRKNSM